MKNQVTKSALVAAAIAVAFVTIRTNALPRTSSEIENAASNLQLRSTYCDLRQYPVPPAALSTDLGKLTQAIKR
jgi:hypothetical protein